MFGGLSVGRNYRVVAFNEMIGGFRGRESGIPGSGWEDSGQENQYNLEEEDGEEKPRARIVEREVRLENRVE